MSSPAEVLPAPAPPDNASEEILKSLPQTIEGAYQMQQQKAVDF
jgi:hypothetical protein